MKLMHMNYDFNSINFTHKQEIMLDDIVLCQIEAIHNDMFSLTII